MTGTLHRRLPLPGWLLRARSLPSSHRRGAAHCRGSTNTAVVRPGTRRWPSSTLHAELTRASAEKAACCGCSTSGRPSGAGSDAGSGEQLNTTSRRLKLGSMTPVCWPEPSAGSCSADVSSMSTTPAGCLRPDSGKVTWRSTSSVRARRNSGDEYLMRSMSWKICDARRICAAFGLSIGLVSSLALYSQPARFLLAGGRPTPKLLSSPVQSRRLYQSPEL
mmetsp:Transcript_30384/g.90057  ORF Transcript_30384/g.90057 Transcript_30384/m.90057 type:complete len:220 (+) Transcript_30384:933-1592(+)